MLVCSIRCGTGQAAKDYRTDADLFAACATDAKSLCADVKPGEGRVQACLVRSNSTFICPEYAWYLKRFVWLILCVLKRGCVAAEGEERNG